MKDYAEYFVDKPEEPKKDSTETEYDYYGEVPSTKDFLKDVLANRYFLQGEDGKSFLMSNTLSDLQYNPNSSLVKSVEDFTESRTKRNSRNRLLLKILMM
jgi:hypothetical protein